MSFHLCPTKDLRLMPDHVGQDREGYLMPVSVNFHNILYGESKTDLLGPEENYFELFPREYNSAPFGL